MSLTFNKVLIIGSEGFIGKKLVTGLLAAGYEIVGADLMDLRPMDYQYFRISRFQPEFEQLFESRHFDYCINAAGSGSVPESITQPYIDFEANIIDTYKLLNALRLNNCDCKYLHLSSAAVYGNPKQLPVLETADIAPVSPYGYHKWISEIICNEFVTLYGLPIVILRPFSAYGPGLRKQLFWDLYQKFKNVEKICLHGKGNESRDFIYIDDILNLVVTMMARCEFKGEVFNVASGTPVSIKEASELFKNILSVQKDILFNNSVDEGNPLFWAADISKIKALGFKPSFTLETGLRQTVQWLKENG